MYIIKGNKKEELNIDQLKILLNSHNKTIVDLGTGDGRFVFKNASENPNNLYIGIDPSEKQLETYSKEANKKRLTNILFVLGSLEIFPQEMENVADYMYINLPWGSLLEGIVNPTKKSVETISKVLKPGSTLEITLGYHDESEPTETARLSLPKLDEELIKETIYPMFAALGQLDIEKYRLITKENLKDMDTTWAKKLTFGNDRPLFKIIFQKHK